MRRWVVAWSVVVALAAAVASAAPPPLTVFAASDLAFAFREIVPKFETAAGARVTLVLGSTGNLAKQIEHGAPADVFFAADQRFVDELVAKGALIAESRALYAQGRLVLATAPGAGAKLTALSQLREPRIRRVAIANPVHAPYGKAAAEAGIVALSIAGVAGIEWVPIDPALHAPLNQAVAVVRRSARPELGLAFIQFVNGPEGRPIMKRYGFALPGEF